MLRLSATSFLLLAVASNFASAEVSVELETKFENWLGLHEKDYHSASEKRARMKVWLANDARIEQHNSQKPTPSFLLGHNAYSDMTEEEFAIYFKLGKRMHVDVQAYQNELDGRDASFVADQRRALLQVDPLDLPDYINWYEQGAVTPIKNQGACGSCWAFSTTGALEGAKFIKTGELVSLSEQNLLDCDHVDLGCSGGLMDNAFKFDEKSGGLCSEADYPYQARQNTCLSNCTDVPGSIVKTFIDVPPGSERALLSAIAMQPISIAIQASQFVFQFYKSGVITDDKCGSTGAVDHGVLAIGYGTDLDSQEPYFLVKNSWGETWGDSGFVKLGRRSKNQFGMCAILKMASFPVVEE